MCLSKLLLVNLINKIHSRQRNIYRDVRLRNDSWKWTTDFLVGARVQVWVTDCRGRSVSELVPLRGWKKWEIIVYIIPGAIVSVMMMVTVSVMMVQSSSVFTSSWIKLSGDMIVRNWDLWTETTGEEVISKVDHQLVDQSWKSSAGYSIL